MTRIVRQRNQTKPLPDSVEKKGVSKSSESQFSKIMTRFIFGNIMLGSFGLILAAGHFYVCMLVVILQVAVFRELVNVRYKVVKEKKIPLFRSLQWCWFAVAMFYIYGDFIRDLSVQDTDLAILVPLLRYHDWVSFSLYALVFVITVLSFTKDIIKYQIGQLTWTLFSVFLIVFQMKFALFNVCNGMFWFVLPVSLVICNDVMAYFCGISCGRKFIQAPFLSLSPNKTWEGFIGGGICTCIAAFFFAGFLAQFQFLVCPVAVFSFIPFSFPASCHAPSVFVPAPAALPLPSFFGEVLVNVAPVQFHAVALAFFASVIAPFGGFFASAIKRAHGLKDFDSVIPGHGGLMDRLDCQFIMNLCAFVYYTTFLGPASDSPMTVSMVLSKAGVMSDADLMALFAALQELMQQRDLPM